ncbi:hypothetical protein [Thermoflavimicrobium dichotomicum]|nr:hypothetical protein [Thermoflavimicrobium dichotomicum]
MNHNSPSMMIRNSDDGGDEMILMILGGDKKIRDNGVAYVSGSVSSSI